MPKEIYNVPVAEDFMETARVLETTTWRWH